MAEKKYDEKLLRLSLNSDGITHNHKFAFSLYTAQKFNNSLDRQVSDKCTLVYIRSGQASLFIDEKCLKLNLYDMAIISPHTEFHLCSSDKQDVITFIELPIALIKEELLNMVKKNEILHSFFSSLVYNSDFNFSFLLCKNSDRQALPAFNQLFYEFKKNANHTERILNFYLVILLEKVTCTYEIFYHENLYAQETIDIGEILKYIEENFSSVSLNELASTFHYSPSYLSSIFKKKTSKKFSDYVKEIKMEKASEYLLNSNHTINEISSILGFSDRSHFFQVFKNYYNQTPLQYKKSSS